MPTTLLSISVRLPQSSLRNLDEAAKIAGRTRSILMTEALDCHLSDIVAEQVGSLCKPRLSKLLSFAGAGADKNTMREATEVDQHIRWLRDEP